MSRDESLVKNDALMKFVNQIEEQQLLYGVVKHAYDPMISNKKNQDPRLRYYNECQEACIVALPTLAKIKDKVLDLKNYKLNMGICKALGQAFYS